MKTQFISVIILAAAGAVAVQAQTVVGTGHVDIGLAYEAGVWDLHVHQEEPVEAEYEPDEVVLQVGAAARTTVPVEPSYGFLGKAGDPIWILPKSETAALIFLGIGTEELDPADWTGNLSLRLTSVSGPGGFAIWDTDLFGSPLVRMNSADGMGASDRLEVIPGSHAHFFYGFTAPGDYAVTFEAAGIFQGLETASGPVTYHFRVAPALIALTNEHTDIRVVYEPEAASKLRFLVRDSDRGIQYTPEEVIFKVPEAARLTLPTDLPPLGVAGAPLWVLPATQDPELLYVGFSGDGVPQAVFDGPIDVRLLSVVGAGEFFLWQTGGTGTLDFQFDTSNGIDEGDQAALHPGGHSHHHWGFSSNGVVRVTLQANGWQLGAITNETSLATTFTFHVLPIADSAFAQWQQIHWPGSADPQRVSADADPDGDGIRNLLEYAFDLDPNLASRSGLPELSVRESAGQRYGMLTFRQAGAATDIEYEPVVSSNLMTDGWTPLTQMHEVVDHGSHQLVTMRDDVPLEGSSSRYYMVRVRFKPGG
jgi:surface-anchored protein